MAAYVWRVSAQEIATDSSQTANQFTCGVFQSKEPFTAGGGQTVTVASAASNQQVTFPTGVTNARFLSIESDQPIVFKLDGTGNYAHTMILPSRGKAACDMDIAFTSLYLSGAGNGSTANVSIIIAGS